MGSFQNGIGHNIYQKTPSLDKKLNTPVYDGITGFEI